MRLSKAARLLSLLALWGCNAGEEARDYSHLIAPEGLLESKEAVAEGATLFFRHCALCHGERGDGQGVRRVLSAPPRDLTDVFWRAQATPEAVYRTIREGVPRTPMAAWRIFSEEQTWSLVAYVLSLAEEPD